MNDERLTTLEIKIAYMEELIQQLNQAIVEQQTRIDHLETANKYLIGRINTLHEPADTETNNEQIPPHY
jgi:SlyX protein